MAIYKPHLLIICCWLALPASAQQMYKTVGPDGKITFTDRPAVEASTRLSVMQSNTLRAIAPPVRKAEARPRRPEALSSSQPVEITREIEEAMLAVMGLADFGRRFESFCDETPDDAKAFNAANHEWKKRNAPAIEQQRRLLTEVVSPSTRANLHDRQQALLSDEIGKAGARSPAARKEWCDGVVAELNSGRSDIDKPAMMAVPIVRYRAK